VGSKVPSWEWGHSILGLLLPLTKDGKEKGSGTNITHVPSSFICSGMMMGMWKIRK